MIPLDVLAAMTAAAAAIGWACVAVWRSASHPARRCFDCGARPEWLHYLGPGVWACERCCRACPDRKQP